MDYAEGFSKKVRNVEYHFTGEAAASLARVAQVFVSEHQELCLNSKSMQEFNLEQWQEMMALCRRIIA